MNFFQGVFIFVNTLQKFFTSLALISIHCHLSSSFFFFFFFLIFINSVNYPFNFPLKIEYSPFNPNRLACATGANFGIVGPGRLWILDVGQNGLFLNQL